MKLVVPSCSVLSFGDKATCLNIELNELLRVVPSLSGIIFIHLFSHHAFEPFKCLVFCSLLENEAELGYFFAFFGARILFLLNDLVNAPCQLKLNQLLGRQHLKSLSTELVGAELVLTVQSLVSLHLVQRIWTFAVLTDYLVPMKHFEQ